MFTLLRRQVKFIFGLQFKRPRSHTPEEFVVLSEGEEAHWEVTERILFIYGKLNPGQSYVQVRLAPG